jgi:hypothetical protein
MNNISLTLTHFNEINIRNEDDKKLSSNFHFAGDIAN